MHLERLQNNATLKKGDKTMAVKANTLKAYNLESIEEYFSMCWESYINGQKVQAKEQFTKLSLSQQKECISYLQVSEASNETINFFISKIGE